jgi:hypothetical protein
MLGNGVFGQFGPSGGFQNNLTGFRSVLPLQPRTGAQRQRISRARSQDASSVTIPLE